MSGEERQAGIAQAAKARTELYDTLAQLRDRLDYAQRVDDSIARAKRRIAAEKRENPLGFAAAAIGVAAVGGLVVWGIARRVARAFE